MPRTSAKRTRVARPVERERDEKYFSKVIGKALDLLAILRASPQPLTLNELTLRVGLVKSSVFRMLHTLEASGYLDRDADGRYLVSPGVRTWGRDQLTVDLLTAANPPMRELSREFGETVSLAVRFDNRIEVAATIDSPQLIRMGNTVGRILPPHASSLGKAIAAFQSEDVRERLIRSYGVMRFTAHTITDEVVLKHEYDRIRERGYSLDQEESVLEGRCFGAPIFGAGRDVSAAISLSLPKMRVRDDETEARLIATLRRTAEQISRELANAGRR
jgi:IclR family acetate operon transcriptional repressor